MLDQSGDLTIGMVVYDEISEITHSLQQLKIEIAHHLKNKNIEWIFVFNHTNIHMHSLILAEIKKSIQVFKYYHNVENNLGLARNIILNAARTDLIYFTDPDIEHPPRTLSGLLKIATELNPTDQKLIGFTGPVIHRSNMKHIDEMFHILHKISKAIPFSFQIQNHSHLSTVDHAPTCHLLIFKKHAMAISGFSSQITKVGEDLDFSHRAYAADLRYLFSPEAHVIHHQNMALTQWLSKVVQFGRAQIMVHKKNLHLPMRFYRLLPAVIILMAISGLATLPALFFLAFIILMIVLYILKPAYINLILTVLSYSFGEVFEIFWPKLKLKNASIRSTDISTVKLLYVDSKNQI
jgi:GT2 family glycosyltransferase